MNTTTPLNSLVQQNNRLLGISFLNMKGEILNFRTPEGNVFAGVPSGTYQWYLDSRPLSLIKIKKYHSIQLQFYPGTPDSRSKRVLEEEIPWEMADGESLVRLVQAIRAGSPSIPYWINNKTVPTNTTGKTIRDWTVPTE